MATREREDQFILRLPPELAGGVREAIRTDTLGERLQVEFFRNMRHARIKFDDDVLNGKLVDLPCMIESHKTLDKKTLYKTGDISQMLVCSTDPLLIPAENVEELPAGRRKEYQRQFMWQHGITPPLKNVRKRRFRKTATKKFIDSPEIEKEVRRLLREDMNAVNVSFKVVTDEDKPNDDSQSVLSESDVLASRGHTPSVMQDEDSFLSTPPSHTADETLRMLEEASCSSSSGSEVEASDEGEMDEDEEEEEDEEEDAVDVTGTDASQSEETMELSGAVRDLENQIEEQTLKIQNTTNPLLRARFEAFLEQLERQRRMKIDELKKL